MSSSSSPALWRKVLVPTDFSDSSLPALRSAAEMRRQSGLEIILLHVTEPACQGLRVQTGDLHARMRTAAEQELEKLATGISASGAGIRSMVKEGRPAEVICQTAAEERVDAILIPTHGHSGLKHALLGSVAEKVVRQAPCCVLVVRE